MTASIRLNGLATPLQVTAGTPIVLSNFNNSGVLGWDWDLLDKPAASIAVIGTPTSAVASITPDVPGTYLIRLRTWADAGKTVIDDADAAASFVRYVTVPTWRIPAAGETTEVNSIRGWAAEVNDILDYIQQNLGGGGGGGSIGGVVFILNGDIPNYPIAEPLDGQRALGVNCTLVGGTAIHREDAAGAGAGGTTNGSIYARFGQAPGDRTLAATFVLAQGLGDNASVALTVTGGTFSIVAAETLEFELDAVSTGGATAIEQDLSVSLEINPV